MSAPLTVAAPLPQLPADHPAQTLAALPASDLIARVQAAGRESLTHPQSQVVFAALYYRYAPYLRRVVRHALGFVHDRDAVQEIVDDALAAFFRASGKFQLARARDDTGCDHLVRAYLAQLARWKTSRASSFQRSFGTDVLDLEELDRRLSALAHPGRADDDADPIDDPRAARVTHWFESLREVERDVVRTYFYDDHAGRKSDRLPDGVAQALAAKHGVTPSNIRHLKRKLQRQLRADFRAP